MDPLRLGDTLLDRYVVEDVIDRGGMGVVYLASHIELQIPVAIKVLRSDLEVSGAVVERMLKEARILARLDSEHVTRVLDAGRLPDGAPFIVMEHLAGEDLATTLAERRRLDVEEAVGFVLQTCDALAEAHAAGIVHLDLKPENLYLAVRSDAVAAIKVLDFGIAADLRACGDSTSPGLTGSPDYMSPEQVLG
ncbi:MAG: serine/threonine protein kinase, partial [Myxococcales bacterium]|nr:serine/threonine protein kinase [Myxococcales bacterium]